MSIGTNLLYCSRSTPHPKSSWLFPRVSTIRVSRIRYSMKLCDKAAKLFLTCQPKNTQDWTGLVTLLHKISMLEYDYCFTSSTKSIRYSPIDTIQYIFDFLTKECERLGVIVQRNDILWSGLCTTQWTLVTNIRNPM